MKPTPTTNGKVSYSIYKYTDIYIDICMFYTIRVWVLKRLLYTDLYRTAHTHLCVIMRQTINFQVHLLRFCPESREGVMYYRLAGQRIQLERYGQRGICVYMYTHTNTHSTCSCKLTLSTDIYFYILRKCILNIFVLWRWQLYVKVKYT